MQWIIAAEVAAFSGLVAPFVAHGVSNTLAFVLIYLDRYPGLV